MLIDGVVFQPVKSIIHALGHNRARQRDKLAHILEEFAALQDEVRDFTSVTRYFKCFTSLVRNCA